MTYEEFIATKKWCDDLGTALSDARWESEANGRGWLYVDSLYIEKVGEKWSLLIDRFERVDTELEPLERELFEFAKAEGYAA